jgi:hypothetical protein
MGDPATNQVSSCYVFVNIGTPKRVSQSVASSRPFEKLSRVGYVVHGFVFIVIGVLAARISWGERGELADPPSAIQIIREQPLGELIVVLIAIGLAAYGLWRFVQAIADPDQQGTTMKGLIVRIGRFISGLGYSALSVFSLRLAAGIARAPEENPGWAVRVLTEPLGAYVGALVAVILLGVASDDLRKAFTANFGERFKHQEMSGAESLAAKLAGSWGFAARALILIFAGAYLLAAILQDSPSRVKGFEGILGSMLALPYGQWLLRFVGLGLVAYGFFMGQAGLRRRHPY